MDPHLSDWRNMHAHLSYMWPQVTTTWNHSPGHVQSELDHISYAPISNALQMSVMNCSGKSLRASCFSSGGGLVVSLGPPQLCDAKKPCTVRAASLSSARRGGGGGAQGIYYS